MIPAILNTALTVRKFPLLLHIITESAAAFTFIFRPSYQLPRSLSFTPRQQPTTDHTPSCSSSSASYCPEQTCPTRTDSRPSKRCLSSPLPPHEDITHSERVHSEEEEEDEEGSGDEISKRANTELNLILLNYGGLLITSNLICLVFILRPVFDEVSGLVSVCMASYHIWPIYRAVSRMRLHKKNEIKRSGVYKSKAQHQAMTVLGGPPLHLVLHSILLGGLIWSGLSV